MKDATFETMICGALSEYSVIKSAHISGGISDSEMIRKVLSAAIAEPGRVMSVAKEHRKLVGIDARREAFNARADEGATAEELAKEFDIKLETAKYKIRLNAHWKEFRAAQHRHEDGCLCTTVPINEEDETDDG